MAGFLFGATAMFAAMYETQAILPTVGRDFGVSPSQSGLTVSLPVISVAIAAWIWGNVSDRIGRRRSLILSSSLLAIPTLAGAFAPSFATFLACRIAQGVCMPGLLIVGVPFVIETYAPKYGGRVMGYYICSLVAGGLLGRVGVAMIASRLRVPVVPVRIAGLDKVLHHTWRMARPGRVRVSFGPALHLTGDDYEALARQVEEAVRDLG